MNVRAHNNSLIFIMLQWGIQWFSPSDLLEDLDQKHQSIRPTKSSSDSTTLDPMTEPHRGNNCIVIFYTVNANHIKSYLIKSCHRMELLCAYNDMYAPTYVGISPTTTQTGQ
ncbi:hypothetical protein ACHAW6_003125 [Cyclotella cf. meneghiniana]